MRGSMRIGERTVTFGFFGFDDWLKSIVLSFPRPWKVRELIGKHYGTEIEDARGVNILNVWMAFGEPSAREKKGMSDDEWLEYCCDSHWESQTALMVSESICACRNAISEDFLESQRWPILRGLLEVAEAQWDESVWPEVRAGGPDKRAIPTDPEIAKGLDEAFGSAR